MPRKKSRLDIGRKFISKRLLTASPKVSDRQEGPGGVHCIPVWIAPNLQLRGWKEVYGEPPVHLYLVNAHHSEVRFSDSNHQFALRKTLHYMSESSSQLRLLLFTTDVSCAVSAQQAGIDSVIVDWERKGKEERQQGYDTEINENTPEDVARLADRLTIPVTVRIDGAAGRREQEVERALASGAQVLMLPMAREVNEVEQFLKMVDGRAKTIIQIETQSLVRQCDALRDLAWDYAYIGLNDLMISRQETWLWEPLLDGTVEKIFKTLKDRSVGFGGVTVVGGGHPIPFTELLREMSRLGCELSFLRRTFKREIGDRDMQAEIRAVRATWQAVQKRGPNSIAQDHQNFRQLLQHIREAPKRDNHSFAVQH